MHHSAYVNAEKFYQKYCEDNIENKKILDVGSYDVNGTMKPIFQKGKYVGLDMEEGPNVDIVGVSHKIPFEKDEFDIVISSSCFEHDDMFWISFQEMCRVLKPGGYMYVQAPSNGPYHGWPGDNWRFYIDSWKALEKWGKKLGYDMELVEHYIDETTPAPPSEGLRFWNDSIGIYRKKPYQTLDEKILISSYRLGDLYQNFLSDEEKHKILQEHPNTIASDYILSEKKEDEKCLETITSIVLKHIEKNKHLLPEDIENSTVVHLRLGDVIGGHEWHEKTKRPHDINYYKNIGLNQNIYVIGKPFFATTSSTNYDESIKLSDEYRETIIRELNAKYFDGGHSDIDLCCAIKCKRFVQGRGFFSDLIVEIRKKIGLENIETSVTIDIEESEMKKVALISSFCDNQEKMDVLEKNIKIIKSHNLDVIVISPFNLPEHLTKQCDYFLITKDNPILNWPTRAMYAWRGLNINGTKYMMTKTYPDYGFAGLTQIKQLSQIALGLDYNQFYHMIYDIKIDENVIEGFHSDRNNSVYPSKRNDDIWPVGLHYLIFNKENLEKFISYINLETYLGVKNGDAFAVLHSLQGKLNYVIEKTPIEDEIYYYENIDFFNFSPIEGLKFFIENDDENPSSIKILFCDVIGEKEIKLKIGETETTHTVRSLYLIDLGFDKFNLQPVTIESDSVIYDITEIIKNIKHSTLKIS